MIIRNGFPGTLLFSALLTVACDRSDRIESRVDRRTSEFRENAREEVREEPYTTTARGGGPALSSTAAIGSIAEARCAREARCNNIGAGKRHASTSACMNEVRSARYDELNSNECPAGIDPNELRECLAEIRNDNCGNPLDAIGRLAACRSSDLCLHTSPTVNH